MSDSSTASAPATAPPTSPEPSSPPSGGNPFGLAALILAALAFVSAVIPIASGFTWLPASAAIVLAIIGLTRRGRPKRFALTGLVVAVVAWLVAVIVTVVMVVAGVGAGIQDGIDGLDDPIPDATASDPVSLGEQVSTADGIGFTVSAVQCGLASTGGDFFDEKPQGEWCRIDYTVSNGTATSVSLLSGDVTAYAAGSAYKADDATGRFGDDYFITDLNPGLSADCVVFVDVPAGTVLDTVGFASLVALSEPVFSAAS